MRILKSVIGIAALATITTTSAQSWQLVRQALPGGESYVSTIVLDDQNSLYVGSSGSYYKSTNNGTSWFRIMSNAPDGADLYPQLYRWTPSPLRAKLAG